MRRWVWLSLVILVVVGFLAAAIASTLTHNATGAPSIVQDETGLVTVIASVIVFIGTYTIREPWWRGLTGIWIVSHVFVVALLLMPFVLSFFFHFNRIDNDIAGYILVDMFYLCSMVLNLGTILWLHISLTRARERRESSETQGDPELRS